MGNANGDAPAPAGTLPGGHAAVPGPEEVLPGRAGRGRNPAKARETRYPYSTRAQLTCDPYGTNLCKAVLPGDGFRKHHDEVKLAVHSCLQQAGMDSNLEVPDYFSQRVGQEATFSRNIRPLTSAQLKHYVPDIQVQGQPCDKFPAGINQLLEIKTIHPEAANNMYEHREVRDDHKGGAATQRRQGQLYDEYRKDLHSQDKKYFGTGDADTGPLETIFRQARGTTGPPDTNI